MKMNWKIREQENGQIEEQHHTIKTWENKFLRTSEYPAIVRNFYRNKIHWQSSNQISACKDTDQLNIENASEIVKKNHENIVSHPTAEKILY